MSLTTDLTDIVKSMKSRKIEHQKRVEACIKKANQTRQEQKAELDRR